MIIIVLENAPASVRGELTRWLLEPRAGVFVGKVSALVREELWSWLCPKLKKNASGLLIYPADNEQGFAFQIHGDPRRTIVDFEGLSLVQTT
jgi:CRISPR-associated protein Cas2